MQYKTVTLWIFVVLVAMVLLLIVYPTRPIIFLSVVGLPLLIALQAWAVLRAPDSSDKDFSDQNWYDKE